MKSILIIARNTYREIIRDRILYGLMVFAVLMIAFSLVLGQLSFAEQARIITNFGCAAIQIGAVMLAIFVGSTLVARELDKKTILTLLVRPLSRTQFLIGKVFGLMGVIVTTIGLLSTVLLLLLYMQEVSANEAFFVGLYGVIIEAWILLSLTIFFGTFSSSILSVSFSIGVFLIGHWIDSLMYFAQKSGSSGYLFFAKIVKTVVPNLELFNWRSLFVYGDPVPYLTISQASFYGLAWIVLLTTFSSLILRSRDLG